jgi:hypothetical protein
MNTHELFNIIDAADQTFYAALGLTPEQTAAVEKIHERWRAKAAAKAGVVQHRTAALPPDAAGPGLSDDLARFMDAARQRQDQSRRAVQRKS